MIINPTRPDGSIFLTAEWKNLVFFNFEVNPSILQPWLPEGTELDFFEGRTYASIVAFQFLNTRVAGLAIPFHRDFDEVNLRFYVRRQVAGESRRGVVFIREMVPRRAIAWVARALYGERYAVAKMSHTVEKDTGGITAEYRWRAKGIWHCAGARATDFRVALPHSLNGFIAEHYWGYARRKGKTVEYRVEHEPWRVAPAVNHTFQVNAGLLYGSPFEQPLSATPASVFIAEGSPVSVYEGRSFGRNALIANAETTTTTHPITLNQR